MCINSINFCLSAVTTKTKNLKFFGKSKRYYRFDERDEIILDVSKPPTKNLKRKRMKREDSGSVWKDPDGVEVHKEEEFDNHCSFLRTHNREKLIQVTCNYFSLGQAELARATLRLLFRENREEDCFHILNSIIYEDPPSKWIASPTIPSSAHLRWFCMSLQREFGVSLREDKSMRWLLEGTQFDILMVCSLLDCDRRTSKQIFNFDVLVELRNCFYISMARVTERRDGVTTPRVPPLDFLPVRGYFGIHRTS